MKKFSTGNVVRLKTGLLVIITNVNDKNTSWISFDSANCSGVTPNITEIRNEGCWDEGEEKMLYEDITYWGMEKAVKLASNVKDYILDRLTKNFNF
jgi:hypothetical protein